MSRSAAKSKKGASGSARGSLPSPRANRAQRRRTGGGALLAGWELTPAAVAALPLALMAAGLPLFDWAKLGDQIVMPRLAASFWLTGAALGTLAWVGGWRRIPWRAAAAPLALLATFLLVVVISTAAGIDPVGSLVGSYLHYHGLLPVVMYGLLLVAALGLAMSDDGLRVMLAGAWLGGTLAAAYAVIQKLGWDWVTWSGVPAGRIGGAFAQPEVLGEQLVVAAAVSVGLLFFVTSARLRGVIAAGIGLMVIGIVLTLARGAWVGSFVGVLVLAALFWHEIVAAPRPVLLAAAGAVIVVLAGVAVLPGGRHEVRSVTSRARSITDFNQTSTSVRLGYWNMALRMTADHPVIGAGPDAFPHLFGQYRKVDQPGIGTANMDPPPESSHNIFLDELVDGGVLRLALYLALIGSVVWIAYRRLPALSEARRGAVGAMLAGLAGYYGAAFFLYAEGMTGWIPWLLMGAILGVALAPEPEAAPAAYEAGDRPLVRALPWAASAVGLALVVFGMMLLIGDFRAGQASRSVAAGRPADALAQARSATHWDPLVGHYFVELGYLEELIGRGEQNQAAAGGAATCPASCLARRQAALDAYHTLNTRFRATPTGLVHEAQAAANVAFTTPDQRAHVFDLLEEATRLDPNNANLRTAIAGFYDSVGESGRAATQRQALDRLQSGAGASGG
ncbi:MAG TPA: O-antigen ligase family protein [Thermomicrobiales bacterium]|nr:O-antigen ligase family protein [Thermomicrobiales bacterium]